jgi:phospho-N-acetylmuramoyl-pentapeptide-transferase
MLNPWWIALVSGLVASAMFAAYRLLAGRRMDQAFREGGPSHHLKKGRVPTGTGIVFVVLLLIGGAVALTMSDQRQPGAELGAIVCWAAAAAGLLGFIDDSTKVRKGSAGLKARFKLPVMIGIGLVLLYLLHSYHALYTSNLALLHVKMPWPVYAPWWLYYPVGLFVWLGAINGANFTDGLDGLLSCTTIVVLLGCFYTLLDPDRVEPLAWPAAIGCGMLLAFLVFNWKPALIYMGDSGSLAVGALVVGLFLAKGWWLFTGLAVIVWVAEVASVILQVLSFRLTGKRVLLMSPLHHHFELAGWGERRTVVVFTLLQALGGLTGFVWLRYGVAYGVTGMLGLILLVVGLVVAYRKRAVEPAVAAVT